MPTEQVTTAAAPTRRPRLRRVLGAAVGLTLVVGFGVGCGSSSDSTGSATTKAGSETTQAGGGGSSDGCTAATNGTIKIVTTNFDFSPDCVTTTGDRLKVTYDNAETGIKHNIHFKDAKSSTGSAMTELKTGPNVQTVTLVGLKPGTTYTYVCDIHSAMKGELKVE